jgi:hypothetical protein
MFGRMKGTFIMDADCFRLIGQLHADMADVQTYICLKRKSNKTWLLVAELMVFNLGKQGA